MDDKNALKTAWVNSMRGGLVETGAASALPEMTEPPKLGVQLPTSLIGVCASSAAVCNTTMRPLMLSAGGLAIAASVIAIMVNELGSERVTPSGPGG